MRILAIIFVTAFVAACQTAAPSAECAFYYDSPLTDAEINELPDSDAKWHDEMESNAARICPKQRKIAGLGGLTLSLFATSPFP